MSVDREYRIKISTVTDGTGADDAAKGLNKAGEASKEAGEKARESSLKHSDLHKMLKMLGASLGEFGHLIHYAFNPWLLATVAVTAAAKNPH